MEFLDIFELSPRLTLAELFALFFQGADNKIYIDLYDGEHNDPICVQERIISEVYDPYYEREILYLSDIAKGCISIYLKVGENNG